MKIALAQIDMRLGDIEGVCARIESQAILAHEQEADLLAVPVPLLAGILPGSLIEVEDFEHDMVSALSALAERLDQLDIAALVPAGWLTRALRSLRCLCSIGAMWCRCAHCLPCVTILPRERCGRRGV